MNGWVQATFAIARVGLIVILLNMGFLFSDDATAAHTLAPEFVETEDQLRFLIYLQREIPWVFNEGTEYDYDFFRLLRAQNQVTEFLRTDETFASLNGRRLQNHSITVGIADSRPQVQKIPSPDLISSLEEYLQHLGKDLSPPSAREEILEATVRMLGDKLTISYSGILTGLVQSLPTDQRSPIFKMSPAEQVEWLSRSPLLTEEALAANFNYEAAGLSPASHDKDSVISALSRALDHEKKLGLGVFFVAYLSELSHQENFVIQGIDVELVKKALNGTPENLQIPGLSKKNLRKLLKAQIYPMTTVEKEAGDVVIKDGIKLRHVPPYLSIFRGLVGGDCSTQTCFGLPYATGLYTYFIYSSDQELKGYVQWSEAVSEGKSYIYLHDIVGHRLSKGSATSVVEGILQLSKEKGFSGVAIPTRRRVEANINYPVLHEVFDAYRDQSPGRIVFEAFPDQAIRNEIAEMGSRLTFDSLPDGEVFLIESQNPSENAYVSKIEEQPEDVLTLPSAIQKDEGSILILNLLASARSADALASQERAQSLAIDGQDRGSQDVREQMVATAAEVMGSSTDAYIGLFQRITEQAQGSWTSYQQSMKAAVAPFFEEVKWDQLRDQNPLVFADGHLSHPDAFDKEIVGEAEFKRSVRFLIALLKRWPQPNAFTGLVRTAEAGRPPEALFLSTPFRNYLLKLLRPDREALEQLTWIFSSGLVPEAFIDSDLLKDLEVRVVDSDTEVQSVFETLQQEIEKMNNRDLGRPEVCALDSIQF